MTILSLLLLSPPLRSFRSGVAFCDLCHLSCWVHSDLRVESRYWSSLGCPCPPSRGVLQASRETEVVVDTCGVGLWLTR